MLNHMLGKKKPKKYIFVECPKCLDFSLCYDDDEECDFEGGPNLLTPGCLKTVERIRKEENNG